MKLLICGNCQSEQMAVALRAILSGKHHVEGFRFAPLDWENDDGKGVKAALSSDLVLTNLSPGLFSVLAGRRELITYPNFYFYGFHPDFVSIVTVKTPGQDNLPQKVNLPISAICAWAYRSGLDVTKTCSLFCTNIFERLGYLDAYQLSIKVLGDSFAEFGLDFSPIYRVMKARTVFMWEPSHPKMTITLPLAALVAGKLGLRHEGYESLIDILVDPLASERALGCFPPIAEYLGVQGSWHIRVGDFVYRDLRSYVSRHFELWNTVENFVLEKYYQDGEPLFRKGINAILEQYI